MDCIEEAVAASKRDRCPVLNHIASLRPQDPDGGLFKALLKCDQALNVPLHNLKLGNTDQEFSYPVLRPVDILSSVVKKGYIQKVLGVPLKRASETFSAFWDKYRRCFPNHEIFHSGLAAEEFASLVPYYLHGDGGRTYKKESILICSMYPALGMETAKSPVPDMQPSGGAPQNRKRPRGMEAAAMDDDEVAMGINLLGNSLGNRFLFVAIHNNYIKNDDSIFYDLMGFWGKEMGTLFDEGFQIHGQIFKIAVLGMCGDAPFIRDAGLMTRSFNNIRKSATANTILPGVCYLCAAGKTHGPDFENLDILTAEWLSTTGVNNLLPWNEPPPILAHIPCQQQNLANFFKGDLFHIWYSGLGKDFCGSSLIFLLKTVMHKGNKANSMSFLNEELRRWQRISKSPPHFGKFTWDLLDYDGPRKYPKGKWSKGMDTGKVTKFIEFLLSEILVENEHGPMLTLIQEGCKSIGIFLRTLFKAGFFLTEQEAHQAISAGYTFLLTYQNLAKTAFSLNKALYKLKPKAHAFAHLVLEMLVQYKQDRSSVCNCVAFFYFYVRRLRRTYCSDITPCISQSTRHEGDFPISSCFAQGFVARDLSLEREKKARNSTQGHLT